MRGYLVPGEGIKKCLGFGVDDNDSDLGMWLIVILDLIVPALAGLGLPILWFWIVEFNFEHIIKYLHYIIIIDILFVIIIDYYFTSLAKIKICDV